MDEQNEEQAEQGGQASELPAGYDADSVIMARNGAIRDKQTGRIVANPGGGKAAITPARSSEYHALWRAKFQERIIAGLGDAAEDAGLGRRPGAAVQAIVKYHAKQAANDDKRAEHARFVFGALGLGGNNGNNGAESGGITINLGREAASQLVQALTQARRQAEDSE